MRCGDRKTAGKILKENIKGNIKLNWGNKMSNRGFWDKMNGASGYIQTQGEFFLLSASEKRL